MEMFDFSGMRAIFFDTSEAGEKNRSKMLESAVLTKTLALAGLIGSGLFTVISLVIAISFPFFGMIGVAFWGASALVCRDLIVLSRNVENVFDDQADVTQMFSRSVRALSPTLFTNSLIESTWIIGPLYRFLN